MLLVLILNVFVLRSADQPPPHPSPAHHWPQHRIQVAVEGVAAGAGGQRHGGGGGGAGQGEHLGQAAPTFSAAHLLLAPGCARAGVQEPSHL